MDTIFALASARGKSGVAVLRISGADSAQVSELFGFNLPKPRQASLRKLVLDEELIDEALVLFFQGPNSFTGEDVIELQVHGSVAVVKSLLTALNSKSGFRLAEPGEFTRRALENDRLDIAQVEALGDLIEAETEAQRQQAQRILSGQMAEVVARWRTDLIRAVALVEATIDFADEDVPVDVYPEVAGLVDRSLKDIQQQLVGFGAAERVRDGFEVAIVGRPNVGKSSLLNALAGRDAAITSSIAGTTRDVIEVRMDLRGLPVTFLDTAGIRDSKDEIESLGIDLAISRAEKSDLRIVLVEALDEPTPLELQPDDIKLVTKSDLGSGDISARTGYGLDSLVEKVVSVLSERASHAGIAIRERHRSAMSEASASLRFVVQRLEHLEAEVIAEELRSAIHSLDELVGHVDVEQILGEIFKNFCIGK